MRTLFHLSDPHFGRLARAAVPALVATILATKPDVVVVSGDLTQRAHRSEFEEAREFLDALPFPQIVVPGNHDVPFYNVIARGLDPFEKYQRYISEDLEPFYSDDEIIVQGINTVRLLSFKNGRINRRQVARSCERLRAGGKKMTRIIVTHHPFDLPEGPSPHRLVGRARMAMAAFARCRVDLILSGHLHVSRTAQSAARYKIPGYSALIIQAGTATSTRGRGELNSCNIIRIDRPRVSIERLTWKEKRSSFAVSVTEHFEHRPEGWLGIPSKRVASEK